MPYRITLIFTVLLFFAASGYAEPRQKIYSDWQITCNNINYCEARNFPAKSGLVMTISRYAGENDRPLLRIDYGNQFMGEQPGAALQDNLLLDGQSLRLDLKHWTVEPHHFATSHILSMNEFFQQIVDAENIQLVYRRDAIISLHGLKAALLYMDDVQGRLNSISAWIKRGPKVSVPAEPDAPRMPPVPASPPELTRDETTALIDFGTWRINTDVCSLDVQRKQVSVAPLTDKKALLLVSCEMGAYNIIDLAYEVSRTLPYVAKNITLTLPFTLSGQAGKKLELVNAHFDTSKGQLLTFFKSRGLGDCGVVSGWRYDGHAFLLAEYAAESVCDNWHGHNDWPTLWISQRTKRGEAQEMP